MLLQQFADVAITIYHARGHVVRQFDIGHQTAGNHISREKAIYWNRRNRSGKQVSSGVYFYTLKTDALTQTRRMVILKY